MKLYSGTTIEKIAFAVIELCTLIIAAGCAYAAIFQGRTHTLIVGIPCFIVAMLCIHIQEKEYGHERSDT